MDKRVFALVAALGCGGFVLLAVLGVAALLFFPLQVGTQPTPSAGPTAAPGAVATQAVIPTLTAPATGLAVDSMGQMPSWFPIAQADQLDSLYDELNGGLSASRYTCSGEGSLVRSPGLDSFSTSRATS
jgi:hypothetical protein